MVKNGVDALDRVAYARTSPDGSSVVFVSTSSIPGGEGAQELPIYLGSRGSGRLVDAGAACRPRAPAPTPTWWAGPLTSPASLTRRGNRSAAAASTRPSYRARAPAKDLTPDRPLRQQP